jgi:hypothetical protein
MNRKQLAKESFKLTKAILDMNIPWEMAIDLSETPWSYRGTDNMTDEELVQNVTMLRINYEKARKFK